MMAKGSVEKQGRLSNLRGKLGGSATSRGDDVGQFQSDSQFHSADDTSALNDPEDASSYDGSTLINENDINPNESSFRWQKENSADNISSFATLPEGSIEQDAGPTNSSFSDAGHSAMSNVLSRDPTKQMEKNRRSSRFGFRKQQDNSLVDSLFGGESLTLKNIYVGHEKIRLHNTPNQDVKTLCVLTEKWMVNVSEIETMSETEVLVSDTEFLARVATVEDANDVGNDADENNGQNGGLTFTKEEATLNTDSIPNRENEQLGVPSKNQCDSLRFLVKLLRVHSEQTEMHVEKQWSFGDVLKLYAGISEIIENYLPELIGERRFGSDAPSAFSTERSSKSDVAEKMIVWGRILGGLLGGGEFPERIEGLGQYQCESIENFLNSLLECPLPASGLTFLSETLGIDCSMRKMEQSTHDSTSDSAESNMIHLEDDERRKDATKRPQTCLGLPEPENRSGAILNLLSACDAELGQVQTRTAVDEGIQPIRVITNPDTHSTIESELIIYDPLLPPSLIDHIHNSLHDALTNVQAERDEMHAKLIGANVMHTHSLERMRKKMERLEISATLSQQIERVQRRQDLQAPHLSNVFGKNEQRLERLREEIDRKIEKAYHVIRNDDADEEMMQLCGQLAGEISCRTSHALEIERFERTREAERKTELAEKEALKDELRRAQELLKTERKKGSEASAEAAYWKSLYEKCRPKEKTSET